MMMILSGAWPQATAWQGRKASAGAGRPAGPGYGLREIQGRESSGGAASIRNMLLCYLSKQLYTLVLIFQITEYTPHVNKFWLNTV